MTGILSNEGSRRQVFLSYAEEDRDGARLLASSLGDLGVSVWWDWEIKPGQNWRREIDEAIQRSSCVVLLWSRHAAASDYVNAEASRAFQERKLIPVQLDPTELPVPYNSLQVSDLSQWDGRGLGADIEQLLAGIRAKLGESTAQVEKDNRSARGARARTVKGILAFVSWILLPSVLLGGIALVMMNWPAPADIELEVIANRAFLHTTANADKLLFNLPAASSIVLREFREIRVPVMQAEAADPRRWDPRADSYPESSWTRIQGSGMIAFRQAGRAAAQVTLRPSPPVRGLLALERLSARDAALTLSSREKGVLNLDLRGAKLAGTVTVPQATRLDLENCSNIGSQIPSLGNTVTLRAQVPEKTPTLEYTSGDSGMSMVLEFRAATQQLALHSASLPVDRLEFLDQEPGGEPLSSLSGGGSIRYAGSTGLQPVSLGEREFLYLDDLRSFELTGLSTADQGLRMRFKGVAGKITSGSGKASLKDRRPTRFDLLWTNHKAGILFTIVGWAIVTSLALRKYLKDYAAGRSR